MSQGCQRAAALQGQRSGADLPGAGAALLSSGLILRPTVRNLSLFSMFGKVLGLSMLHGRGGESGPLSRGQQPSGVNSCQAKGKLDFCENWAALEVRTLRPVRGDFSEKGRLTTGRGRAADRPCCTAWKCEDSSVPVYWEALKIHRGVIFITLPQ